MPMGTVRCGVTSLVTRTLCQQHHNDDGMVFAPESKRKQSRKGLGSVV